MLWRGRGGGCPDREAAPACASRKCSRSPHSPDGIGKSFLLAPDHPFAKAGLRKDDVIIGAGGKDVLELGDLLRADVAGKARRPLELRVLRKQAQVGVRVP